MGFNAADLLVLKDELTNDPNGLGLTLLAADDVANADKLNEVLESQQIDREAIPISEIVKAVDADEFIALSQPQRDYLKFVTMGESVNPQAGGEVREALLQMFGPTSETRAKLIALLTEASNRINQMFKLGLLSQGGNVTPSDVANARNAV